MENVFNRLWPLLPLWFVHVNAQTPSQVTTAWSMHRGLIALHTAGSLNVGESVPPPPATAKGRTRRGSSNDGNLGDQTLRRTNNILENLTHGAHSLYSAVTHGYGGGVHV